MSHSDSNGTVVPHDTHLAVCWTPDHAIEDYRTAIRSREASLIGRKEVLTGKAKFGIFGDGKEVPQLAMARAFRRGDFRSGYYRDQTFHLALGMLTLEQFFAQLYADPDPVREPCSSGRQMNAHFASRSLDPDGRWRDLVQCRNSSADLSPTGSQMPRLVGLAYASKLYRQLEELWGFRQFSDHGNEVAFGTIGDASCAEGMFWEAINAAGVLRVPMLLSVWDDGYGISVPNRFQITKGHLSHLLEGFARTRSDPDGFDIHTVHGWDYPSLCEIYHQASASVRDEHVPTIIHVTELTQPLGHSTSGSQERYKSAERLAWEKEFDCVLKMRQWIVREGLAGEADLEAMEGEDREQVRDAQGAAWDAVRGPIERQRQVVVGLLGELEAVSERPETIQAIAHRLERRPTPGERDLLAAAHEALVESRHLDPAMRQELLTWKSDLEAAGRRRYDSHLHSDSSASALEVAVVEPRYSYEAQSVRGFEILTACFDAALGRYPNMVAFGEDLGALGDVNQGFAGLQEKYGPLRVSDTGIRETTIIGEAIGLAMRGIRPVAEIQYLDYILYALQIISDDLATLRWRTGGGQKAPVIVRTRGHRLEGIWHSGSPMAAIINLVRGIWVCVPRDMTRAAGFYNTLLQGDDPAIVIEVLNGYRLKEKMPDNIGEMALPLGVPEVLREGDDVTVVTYGALCSIALEAATRLADVGIGVELIDVQTLLPFDRRGSILESLRKTGRILFLDEDVPGGTTAFMMRQVMEVQGGYEWLDGAPRTLTSSEHRPAFGSDGDYFSKPNREQIFDTVYDMMHEAEPDRFPRGIT